MKKTEAVTVTLVAANGLRLDVRRDDDGIQVAMFTAAAAADDAVEVDVQLPGDVLRQLSMMLDWVTPYREQTTVCVEHGRQARTDRWTCAKCAQPDAVGEATAEKTIDEMPF